MADTGGTMPRGLWWIAGAVSHTAIVAISVMGAGCKTYTAVPYDSGDGRKDDGGVEAQSAIEAGQETSVPTLPDGGADRTDLPAQDSSPGDTFDVDQIPDAPPDLSIDQRPVCTLATAGCACLGGLTCDSKLACRQGICIPITCGDGIAQAGEECDDANTTDTDGCSNTCKIAPPRLIAPLSTATVTSRRPVLRWALVAGTDGAHVQICRDRACTNSIVTFDAVGTSGLSPTDLPVGVVFWRAYGRLSGASGSESSKTWQFNVGARSALVNASSGTTLDVNGDGYADVLIGGDQANRAYLYPGSPSGLSPSQVPIILTVQDVGRFGYSVASAGDVNGDGYADIIIGAFTTLTTGRAYVYLGGPVGLSPASQPIVLTSPDGPGENFGISVASAGDVNGDGYADSIVGANNVGGATLAPSGRAHIYMGSPSGPSPSSPINLESPGGQGSIFGNSVASAGDINGDGYADVAVGAPGASNMGRAYLYLGGAAGVSASQLPVSLSVPGGQFGYRLAGAEDFNGDGYSDVFVGASVGAQVYLGGASGISSSQQPINLSGNSNVNVASAGDINGDGYGDVLVGATVYQGAPLVGPSSALVGVTLTNPDAPSGSAAGLGDINGDGYADVITANDGYLDCLGRAYVYLGSASGMSPTQIPITLTGTDLDGEFGVSLASASAPRSLQRGSAVPAAAPGGIYTRRSRMWMVTKMRSRTLRIVDAG